MPKVGTYLPKTQVSHVKNSQGYLNVDSYFTQLSTRPNESKRKLTSLIDRFSFECRKTKTKTMIGFGLASDWLSRWREFFKPITERSKAKLPVTILLLLSL